MLVFNFFFEYLNRCVEGGGVYAWLQNTHTRKLLPKYHVLSPKTVTDWGQNTTKNNKQHQIMVKWHQATTQAIKSLQGANIMSSPHMSFRLNHYQLAKALRILITLEPNQPLPSLSQVAKTIIIDWISKHSINASLNTSQADIDAIKRICEIPANQIDPYTTIQSIMSQALLQQVNTPQVQQVQKSEQQIQQEIRDEKIFAEIKREALEKQALQEADTDKQIELISQPNQSHKASDFDDPNITESNISSVTDFSPPSDWKE